ncbi:unnamed protein product [Schistosoma curassoni]|uniref:Uncharacterized protein n=1 Tax=Schistosoma curassoni TaxID=6186 RepID=A0A183K5A4_9TREM|nr:unnamed protein product [Schistosoma curassoni]
MKRMSSNWKELERNCLGQGWMKNAGGRLCSSTRGNRRK